VEGLCPIGSVLREILPKTSGKAVEYREGAPVPPVHLVVLEPCQRGDRYDAWPSLIGLTCQPVESAMLDPQLVSFDAQEALLLKMPFDLNDLFLAIERFPRGAVRLFRHPGLNLLWHYKDFVVSSHPNPGMKRAIDRRVHSGFSELANLMDRPREFSENLIERIILSLYPGLCHSQTDSLEALISELARSHSNHVPLETFLLQIQGFFERTQYDRRNLALQAAYFGPMAEVQAALGAERSTRLVGKFQQLHQSLSRELQQLEAAGERFLTHQKNPNQVFEASLRAAQELGALLDDWDKLKRRVSHDAKGPFD